MTGDFYETDRAVSEYLLFHFGEPQEVCPFATGPREALDYPRRCVSELFPVRQERDGSRALDLGCAVGRSTFELARTHSEVVGIDYSARFIDAANRLRAEGRLAYDFVVEGETRQATIAKVPEGVDRRRARFECGDAQALRQDLGQFDAVLLANLIDRVARPRKCLEQMRRFVKAGGVLAITSPYTWLEEFTPKDEWLGGRNADEQARPTWDRIREILAPEFELIARRDLPFLIREHARKYQWSVAEATVWKRNGV